MARVSDKTTTITDTVRIGRDLFVRYHDLYDPKEGWYNGMIPLPDMPLPGMAVEYISGSEFDTIPDETHILRWMSMEDDGTNTYRAEQGWKPWSNDGFWRGSRLRRTGGESGAPVDKWRFIPDPSTD